ncbi:sugar transporter ERD6-like 16 isoform X1 [Sesamum indicum]|uniref:Sugar transporter ERD6-like 16 isoform X1 n=1 Tax=Sesamum indicum TaxID=4182 RepID=A0A6I9TXF5_SESIN|nr:sugar transporter ERD6-like 16 isoform X1 [Sesamum indicum]
MPIENASDELEKPFIQQPKSADPEGESGQNGSIFMVLLSTFVAICGSFEFGICVGYSSPTQSSIRHDLNLSLSEFSLFGSIITIGAMFGSITSGRIADYLGRKGSMRLAAVICIAGWVAVYFSKAAWSLDVGRFSTGYGIGLSSFVVPVFIGEIAPKHLRGGLATLNQLLIVCGSSFVYIVGTIVTWRTLALTGLIPSILVLVGLFFIPESPRWLLKVGRRKDFDLALRKLRGKDADISHEAADIQAGIAHLEDLPKVGVRDLFDAKYTRAIIIAVGLFVFQQFGGINGINFYSGEILAEAGFSREKGQIAYAIIQVPITLIGATLMDKSGRRPLLMVSATGMGFGSFLIGAAFYLKAHALLLEWVPMLAISGVLLYIATFSIGMGAVPWVIMGEIFPIYIKGIAGSLVCLVHWSVAWLISYTFNFLMTWNAIGTFWIYAGFSMLTVLFVAKVVPETKGKTLEEIQAALSAHRTAKNRNRNLLED